MTRNLDRNLDNYEVAEIIRFEGLEYTVCEYLNPNEIGDMELRKLWIEAKNSMLALLEYLKDYYEEE